MGLYATLTSGLEQTATRRAKQASLAPRLQRAVFIGAIGIALGLGLLVGTPGSVADRMDPDLVRLLHAMVGIKGIIALAAAALVYRRFGYPLPAPVAVGYGSAICLSALALGWLWTLASIPLGALAFYAGLIGLILVGRFDPALTLIRKP